MHLWNVRAAHCPRCSAQGPWQPEAPGARCGGTSREGQDGCATPTSMVGGKGVIDTKGGKEVGRGDKHCSGVPCKGGRAWPARDSFGQTSGEKQAGTCGIGSGSLVAIWVLETCVSLTPPKDTRQPATSCSSTPPFESEFVLERD